MPRPKKGSRAFHTKSRNSCLRCKQRRVRCNLQSPECSNCHRRRETCEYQSEISIPYGSAVSPQSQFPTDRLQLLVSYVAKSPNLGLHFNIRTFLPETLWKDQLNPLEIQIWDQNLAINSRNFNYLQHALLSLSSLHSEAGDHGDNLQDQVSAYQHHYTASKLFHSSAPAVSDNNWAAVLLFGASVIIFHFATQQTCQPDAFDYMEMLRVLRISRQLAREVAPFLFNSELWRFIRQRVESSRRPLESTTMAGIERLGTAVETFVGDSSAQEARLHALESFKIWVMECDAFPRTWRHYIYWPATVREEFLDLLSKDDDVSLLILIHWCTILHLGPKRWFLETWPRRTATCAMARLKGEWGDLLEWPLSVLSVVPIPG